jgi:hypothetical protein
MTGRTERDLSRSLPGAVAPTATSSSTRWQTGTSRLTGTAPSNAETTMNNLIPEQMARSHLDSRQREAEQWRMRRAALAVRRAEAAERRARLAREAAVLAVRESHALALR